MEELKLELDDEIAAWLEAASATQNKSISEIIGEMIRELRDISASKGIGPA